MAILAYELVIYEFGKDESIVSLSTLRNILRLQFKRHELQTLHFHKDYENIL